MPEPVNFRAIKATVDMSHILMHYGLFVEMQTKGERITGLCPFHKEDTPSFQTTPNRRGYYCFGCQAKGNVITFVRHKEQLADDWQAARRIQEWFAIAPQSHDTDVPASAPKNLDDDAGSADTNGELATPWTATLKENKPLSWQLDPIDPGHAYLQTRGLHPATIRYFGLGHYGGRGIMAGRIVIPIHNSAGQLVAYAGRWPGETPPSGERKYKLPSGFHKSSELYNLNHLSPVAKTVIVVEGYWSVFHLHQLGIRNVVALMGTSISQAQCQRLGSRFQRAIIFFDGDQAGREGTDKAVLSLAPRLWVKAVTCPAGKQPDDLTLEALRSLLPKGT